MFMFNIIQPHSSLFIYIGGKSLNILVYNYIAPGFIFVWADVIINNPISLQLPECLTYDRPFNYNENLEKRGKN